MTLLAAAHNDRRSAAHSITANRASKIVKLADSGLDEIAGRFLTSLALDVCEYIADEQPNIRDAQALCNIITITADNIYHGRT